MQPFAASGRLPGLPFSVACASFRVTSTTCADASRRSGDRRGRPALACRLLGSADGEESPKRSNGHILLVEDNPDDVDLTLRAFERQNIKNPIVVTRDGEEALEYLFGTGRFTGRVIEEQPALILLDLKLPKVDGLEVLKRLREHPITKLDPVVILSSSREDHDLLRGYSLGANSYVRKPVDFGEFMEAVRELGVYWLLINELPPRSRAER
jgi:two-component system response regulator